MGVTMVGADTTNMVFGEGYMFATISGEGEDSTPFGKAAGIDVNVAQDLVRFYGPGSHEALAAAVGQRTVTGTIQNAAIRPNQLRALLGGTRAYSDPTTTYTLLTTDEGVAFNLHAKTPSDGSDFEIKLYNCLCPNVSLPLTDKAFSIQNAAFEAFGESSGNKVLEVLYAGDLTYS